ncbi:MAG: PEP-CTERM sorting domain-containing protein [Planctomycetaceae bacterium]
MGTGAATGAGAFAASNPGFDGFVDSSGLLLPDPGLASIQEGIGFLLSPPVLAGPVGAGVTSLAVAGATEVLLARFAVSASGGVGDDLILTPDRLGAGVDGNIDGLGGLLDATLASSGSTESVVLTINSTAAVPEPSTLLVASLLGGGYMMARRRRVGRAESASSVA